MRIRVPREWTLAQLAEAAGLHRSRVRRLLEAQGVAFEQRGRVLVVRTVELKEKTPMFWRSLEAVVGWGAMRERLGQMEVAEGLREGSGRATSPGVRKADGWAGRTGVRNSDAGGTMGQSVRSLPRAKSGRGASAGQSVPPIGWRPIGPEQGGT